LFKSAKLQFFLKPCEGFRLPIWFIAGGVSIAAAAMQPDRWAIKIGSTCFWRVDRGSQARISEPQLSSGISRAKPASSRKGSLKPSQGFRKNYRFFVP
jgi:hypothetical protein